MPKNGTAIYLRCYPEDRWEMISHRHALEDLAHRAGLARPILYLDNGTRSTERGPRLERLLGDLAAGYVDTVLIPGTWVFALCPDAARTAAAHIRAAGARLIELTSPRTGAPCCSPDLPTAPALSLRTAAPSRSRGFAGQPRHHAVEGSPPLPDRAGLGGTG